MKGTASTTGLVSRTAGFAVTAPAPGPARGTTTRGRNAARLVAATAVTLLLALAALAVQASPAFAQDETLTVTRTGAGTVTSDPAGINCGDDCSEPYPSSTDQVCIENGPCRNVTLYQSVTLTAAPAPGWAFQSWSSNCSGTGTTCTVAVNEATESVSATFIRISPPNDDFANAQLISGADASVNGTTRDATREDPGEPRHSAAWTGDHTVWYSWTAPRTGEWNLDTCQANIDSILAVYTGDRLDSLTKIRDDNNGCSSGFGSKLTFRATAGATYRIVVGDAGGAVENTFTLALAAIPPPTNDDFDSAQLVSGAGASVDGTNVSATRESGDPWGGTPNAERSVWYRWTAPFSGSATVDTCATNYDSLLSVSRNLGSLVTFANNGCPNGFGDKLSFSAQKDQTYYIGVDGCCGAPAGTFTLALDLVDDVAPDTRISRGPDDGSATSNTSLTFAFDASEPGSTFKCRVYPAALTPPAFDDCSGAGTHTASGFGPGTYSFEVRATDAAGNNDPTPARRTFTVDTAPPNTTITSGPTSLTRNTSASFAFSSDETGSSFECSLDGGAFTSCASPKGYSGLSNGTHTFSVRAKDAAGNVDGTPAVRAWTVDTAKPTVGSVSPRHKAIIRDATPTIEATVKDNRTLSKANIALYVAGKRIPAAKFKYGASGLLVYNSPKLARGKKTVRIVATDSAGNVGAKSWYFAVR